ncbi:NAD(P)-dependent oxidoreductase [Phocaeicola dorei]|nr:NAD(P)-dependent oxidoreductase [Phocaeicola dorei]
MNYFITGGSGFIGTHLTNLLKERFPHCHIYNLDIVENSQEGKVTYIYCDVRKPIHLEEVTVTEDDVIFNFAAVHRTPGHSDHEYFETNILGAENVTAFAEKYGIRRIVFTSSIAPYGAAENLKEEITVPTPNTPYGISKLVAEKIHTIWQAKNSSERQLTIVRPGVVFGKGENGNFTRLYWGLRGRKFMYPGRKDTVKACIYVKELVCFMLYRLEHHEQGVELYNCTFELTYTIEQIVATMNKVTGLNRTAPLIPAWILMPAAAVIGCLGAPMGICPARVRKLMVSTNICGKKLADSGYHFHYTFEEAIADWFKDNDNQYLK